MLENLTWGNLIRMKSTYAIRLDNCIIFLQLKYMGDACGENTLLGKLFICFCLAVVLFVPIHTFADEKREWRDEVIYSIMIDRFNNGEPKNDKLVRSWQFRRISGAEI